MGPRGRFVVSLGFDTSTFCRGGSPPSGESTQGRASGLGHSHTLALSCLSAAVVLSKSASQDGKIMLTIGSQLDPVGRVISVPGEWFINPKAQCATCRATRPTPLSQCHHNFLSNPSAVPGS
jgi:hypothetical protein